MYLPNAPLVIWRGQFTLFWKLDILNSFFCFVCQWISELIFLHTIQLFHIRLTLRRCDGDSFIINKVCLWGFGERVHQNHDFQSHRSLIFSNKVTRSAWGHRHFYSFCRSPPLITGTNVLTFWIEWTNNLRLFKISDFGGIEISWWLAHCLPEHQSPEQ